MTVVSFFRIFKISSKYKMFMYNAFLIARVNKYVCMHACMCVNVIKLKKNCVYYARYSNLFFMSNRCLTLWNNCKLL